MSEYPWNEKNNIFTWLSSLYNPFKGHQLQKMWSLKSEHFSLRCWSYFQPLLLIYASINGNDGLMVVLVAWPLNSEGPGITWCERAGW